MPTRVFIADDHPMVRVGLRQVLTELGGFDVVGEAENGRQVLDHPQLTHADVLVLDLSLPVIGGTEVIARLKDSPKGLPVVVHSMHPESQFRRRALEAGAVAYVPKSATPDELIEAVRMAAEHPWQRQHTEDVEPSEAPHASLTRREHQVFMGILAGKQVVDLAAELDVHACTVSNHLGKIRTKLGVTTVAEIVRYAYAHGILEAPA